MPKRGDNIHKRKDGRWEGRYKKGRKPDGTIIYGSIYGKSYHEIKDKLSQSDCSNKFETNASCKNLRDVLSLWMAQNRLRLKGGTINKYQNLIDTHILPELGSLQMKRIDVAIINAFLVKKKENGRVDGKGELSPAYVRGIALVLNSALKYAVQEGLCAPMKSSICKPTLEKQQVTVLSQTELQRLGLYVQGSDTTVCLGVAISLHTGLRIGEVCALQWEDIDFRNNILNVRHTVARIKDGKTTKLILDTPKTQSSLRQIPIAAPLSVILIRAKAIAKSLFVVSNKEGFANPRSYDYQYHKLLKACGIASVNFHVLRHTFATNCVEAGVDIKSLSEILGHSNVSVTLNTYVHSSIEQKRKQLEKLSVPSF